MVDKVDHGLLVGAQTAPGELGSENQADHACFAAHLSEQPYYKVVVRRAQELVDLLHWPRGRTPLASFMSKSGRPITLRRGRTTHSRAATQGQERI